MKFWNRNQRIFIIPTRYGLLFFALVGALMMIAATYANNLIFLLSFFLFSLAVAAMLQTHSNLKGLCKVRVAAASGEAGKDLHVWVEVENPKRSRASSVTADCFYFQHAPSDEAHFTVNWDFLVSRGVSRVDGQLPKLGRGIFRFRHVRLSTRYPLGLFYAWIWLPLEGDFAIHPKPVGDARLPVGNFEADSVHHGGALGGSDFSGHRKWEEGESHRHVDWKALARGRPRMVKQFREGAPQIVLADLKDCQGVPLEAGLEQLALWILEAHKLGLQFGLTLDEKTYAASSGSRHLQNCLRALAGYGAKSEEAA